MMNHSHVRGRAGTACLSIFNVSAGILLLIGCKGGSDRTPHADFRTHEAQYDGPGREDLSPDVETVRIGWFGPAEPNHPTAGLMWCATTMAVEEANAAGGFNGKPFELLPRWSSNPWGTGIQQVTKLIYDDKVWAIAGAPDGPSAHLVEQVATKARVPFVSTVSTDTTVNRANVPWVFSCAPGDHIWVPVLAEAVAEWTTSKAVTLVASTDHDARSAAMKLSQAGVLPARRIDLKPGRKEFADYIRVLRDNGSRAVIVLAGPLDAARFVKAARHLDVKILGGPAMGQRAFVAEADDAAEDVLLPLLWDRDGNAAASNFADRFEQRFNRKPDYTAAYTYDGVTLLIKAIRRAGLNRARIRDAIRGLSGWRGATGMIRWDPTGLNVQTASLGIIRDGQPTPMNP